MLKGSNRRGRAPSDAGVSPVVGMILVLAISVVGITTVLYWGLPAIDEMKANVEARSVQSQFLSFVSDVQELEAGTAGKTSKRWQPSLDRGEIRANGTVERWAVAWDLLPLPAATETYNFTWGGLDDNDNALYIKHAGTGTLAAADTQVKAYKLDGTLATEEVASETQGTATQPATIDGSWTADETLTFYVMTANSGGGELNLNRIGWRIEIYHLGVLVSQMIVVDTGEVRFDLEAGAGAKEVVTTNGGLISGTNGAYAFLNSPPVPKPKVTESSYRLFIRLVRMNGTAQFAGGDRFDLLVNLYGNMNVKDLACDTTTDCVAHAKLYPLGDFKDVWRTFYLNPNNGYFFTEVEDSIGGGTVKYLQDSRTTNGMSFTLLLSVLTVAG